MGLLEFDHFILLFVVHARGCQFYGTKGDQKRRCFKILTVSVLVLEDGHLMHS
jgi:hypothetical protein